jgi:4-diphosphocytidyl-2-C-methyl-D-erythritol kinase
LTPLAFVARRYLVVYPGVHTATAAMFSHPDLPRSTPRITAAAYLEGAPVGNDFEALACALHADIARARQYLSTHIGRPRLTGSGSALFVELEPGQTPDLAGAPLNWHSRICNSLQNPFDSVDMATSESRAP